MSADIANFRNFCVPSGPSIAPDRFGRRPFSVVSPHAALEPVAVYSPVPTRQTVLIEH